MHGRGRDFRDASPVVGSAEGRMLYVHVPFCRAKCRYCAFYSSEGADEDAERDYVDGALREMRLAADRYGDVPLTSVFFGGGTPSLLSLRSWEALFQGIADVFRVLPDAEVTVEGNPESLSRTETLLQLRRSGVNRLSIGMQSLADAELRTLGRIHTAAQAERSFRMARDAGFDNIGVDLIWGVPGQTEKTWERSLDRTLALHPDHVSAYGLTIEAGTPMERDIAEGRLSMPDEDVQVAMYDAAVLACRTAGYEHYEISSYCRTGKACRHNRGYWAGMEYIGIGPSAVGTIGGRRYANPSDMGTWQDLVRGGVASPSERLGAVEAAEEMVLLALRTADGLDVDAYRLLTGKGFAVGKERFVEHLVRCGLAGRDGRRFFLTDRGMLISNGVIAELFDEDWR